MTDNGYPLNPPMGGQVDAGMDPLTAFRILCDDLIVERDDLKVELGAARAHVERLKRQVYDEEVEYRRRGRRVETLQRALDAADAELETLGGDILVAEALADKQRRRARKWRGRSRRYLAAADTSLNGLTFAVESIENLETLVRALLPAGHPKHVHQDPENIAAFVAHLRAAPMPELVKRHAVRFYIERYDERPQLEVRCPYDPADPDRPCRVWRRPTESDLASFTEESDGWVPDLEDPACWVVSWATEGEDLVVDGRIEGPWIDVDYRNDGGLDDSRLVLVALTPEQVT